MALLRQLPRDISIEESQSALGLEIGEGLGEVDDISHSCFQRIDQPSTQVVVDMAGAGEQRRPGISKVEENISVITGDECGDTGDDAQVDALDPLDDVRPWHYG